MSKQLMEVIKKQYTLHRSFCRYLAISIFVTVIDTIVSRVSEIFVNIIIANSIGILTGFTVQYFLSSRHVFFSKGAKTFVKFFLTFVFGFVLANVIVYIGRILVFDSSEAFFAFAVSKGFSIVIPFFLIYFIRMRWIKKDPDKETPL